MQISYSTYRILAPTQRVLLGVLAILLGAGAVASSARAQVTTTAVPFLLIEPDSRAAGMGNTGVALADNANAIFWNPAGLAFQEAAEIGFTHTPWLPEFNTDLYFEYLSGKYHAPGVGTFGANVTFFYLGEYERRTEANEENPDTFRSYELAVGGSYGRKISERFALGTSLRFIYSDLAEETGVEGQQVEPGKSVAVDLAGLYRTEPFTLGGTETVFSAGFNLANLGPKVQYVEDEFPIPTNLRLGYSFTFNFDEYNELTFSNDFTKVLVNQSQQSDSTFTYDPFYKAIFSSWGAQELEVGSDREVTVTPLQQIAVATGLEYWYNDLFALRTGYYYEHPYNGDRQFLTFGAGLRYNIIGVDFSYIYGLEQQATLSNTMRFSVLFNFR